MIEEPTSQDRRLGPLRPRLHPEPVVYAIVAPGFDAARALATVREREGLTVIVEQVDADDDGLVYDFIGAWISLELVTALDGIGITASIAGVLAGQDIACNVVAGFHHDHFVVPWDRRHDAMAAIGGLE